MADGDEIIREPINKKQSATAEQRDTSRDITREPIVREQQPAGGEAEATNDYGFNTENLVSNARQGLYEMGKGGLTAAKDFLFSEGIDPKTGQEVHGVGGLVGMGAEGGFHPLDRAGHLFNKYVTEPAREEIAKSKEAAGRGEYSEATGHALASALPVVGPWAASMGEQAKTGDVGGAVARGGTQVIAGELLPRTTGHVIGETGKVIRGLKRISELGEETPRGTPPAPPTPPPRPAAAAAPAPTPTPTPPPPGPATTPRPTPGPTATPITAPAPPVAQPAPSGTLPRTGPPEAPPPTTLGGERPAPATLTQILRQATGQPEPAAPPPDPLKAEFPNAKIRGYARANGPELVRATIDRPEVLEAVHKLTNVEIRQAAINADIDLGTRHVGSRIGLGPEQISRQDLIAEMLRKGVKPEDIPELSKPKK